MADNDPSTLDLNGRRALVTGGASGIGAGTARRLAERGAEVVIGDIDLAGAEAVAAEFGGTATQLDVADPEAWERVVARYGPFDIGFLNAGISTPHERPEGELPILGLPDEAYRRIMAINLDGVVFGARALLPDMVARGHGDLVATASLAGLTPIWMDPIYGLTKHGVVGFVRSLGAAMEQHPDRPDICVSAVCPGFTDTNILSPEAKERITSLGVGMLHPADIGDVVLRSLTERVQGAEWVAWAGLEPHRYEWAPALPMPGA
jgi:NAD(P)-dependent dehydrogenase (short-subunit alcohol dehydrogenase family)